jgi:Cytochrome c oxidase subunit VIIc
MNTIGLRAARASRFAQLRGFSSSVVRSHGPSGPYSNLPFKVHGRKYVPYWVLHFGFFGEY